MRALLPLFAVLFPACATSSLSPVTAQRPTFSSDTATTGEGTLELEAGARWDPGDDQLDTPTTLRYGAGPATEVFVGWSPYLRTRAAGGVQDGAGDVLLGLRHRFLAESGRAPSAALQATLELPAAASAPGPGSGELDAALAGIVTKTLGVQVLTGYYDLSVLGDPAGGTDVAHGLALAATTPVAGRTGAFGELAGVFVPERRPPGPCHARARARPRALDAAGPGGRPRGRRRRAGPAARRRADAQPVAGHPRSAGPGVPGRDLRRNGPCTRPDPRGTSNAPSAARAKPPSPTLPSSRPRLPPPAPEDSTP